MKKTFKFLFAIILSLIVIDNVKADDYDACSKGGVICYYGTSGSGNGFWVYAKGSAKTSYIDTSSVAYRVTFFNEKGKQLGNSIDYYPNGSVWGSNYVYYKNPKFYYKNKVTGVAHNLSFIKSGSTGTATTNISSNVAGKFPKSYPGSDDKFYELVKNGSTKDAPNTFLKNLMQNASNYSELLSSYKNGTLWVSIEPIFAVKVILATGSRDPQDLHDECIKEARRLAPNLRSRALAHCNLIGGTKQIYDGAPTTIYYKGTGTEMALILNYLYNNSKTYGLGTEADADYYSNGLGFIRCTTFKSGGYCSTYENFNRAMYIDVGIPNLFVNNYGLSWENLARGDSQWGLNAFKVSPVGEMTEPPTQSCNSTNYKTYGRDWNPTTNKCCDAGETYNPTNKKCEPPSVSLNYKYTCNANLNICMGVDHSFESLSSSSVGNAECVLHNDRYRNGARDIWCYETTDTNLSSITNNLTSVTSGRFVAVTGAPTSSISGTCYMPNTNGALDQLKQYVNSTYSSSNIGNVSLKFFDNNASYTPGTTTVSLRASGTSTTEYGEKYAYVTFSVDYSYSTGTINKYVNKLNASGYTDKNGLSQYNTNYYNTNFKTPVLQAAGTYTDKLSVGLNIENVNTISSKLSSLINAGSSASYTTHINVTDSDYCPGTCSVKISSKNDSNYLKTLSNFATSYSRKFKNFTSTIGEDEESATDCNIKCITTSEKSNSYCQNNCPKKYSYTTFTFTTDTRKQCESTNTNAKFTPDNKNGCDVTLNFTNTKTTSGGTSLNCPLSVTVENELTTCDKNSPTYNSSTGLCDRQPFDKLVFRPIDLSNPFPGYSGTGRVSGSNWTSFDIQNYITNRQDVYTQEPLYTVILTPTEIKEIREYNKSNNYDDFNLDCKDDNSRACYSSFIRNYLDENKSKCYNKLNQDKTTFESCTDYDSSTPVPTPTPTPTQPPRS